MFNIEIQKGQSNEVGASRLYFPPVYKASQYNFSGALWKDTTLQDLAITLITSLRGCVCLSC